MNCKCKMEMDLVTNERDHQAYWCPRCGRLCICGPLRHTDVEFDRKERWSEPSCTLEVEAQEKENADDRC